MSWKETPVIAAALNMTSELDMNWIILIIAGCFESGFAFCLGKMKGLIGTPWYLWGAGFILCLTLSMILLSKAVQSIPIGTAYPVWTGIGAVGTVIVGILFFNEPLPSGGCFSSPH